MSALFISFIMIYFILHVAGLQFLESHRDHIGNKFLTFMSFYQCEFHGMGCLIALSVIYVLHDSVCCFILSLLVISLKLLK